MSKPKEGSIIVKCPDCFLERDITRMIKGETKFQQMLVCERCHLSWKPKFDVPQA